MLATADVAAASTIFLLINRDEMNSALQQSEGAEISFCKPCASMSGGDDGCFMPARQKSSPEIGLLQCRQCATHNVAHKCIEMRRPAHQRWCGSAQWQLSGQSPGPLSAGEHRRGPRQCLRSWPAAHTACATCKTMTVARQRWTVS